MLHGYQGNWPNTSGYNFGSYGGSFMSTVGGIAGGIVIDYGLGKVGQAAQDFCRAYPTFCNIVTPGARFPTEQTGTPAPSPNGSTGGGIPLPGGPVSTSPGGMEQFMQGRPAAPAGYHWNKGTYWTTQGVVFKGTRVVKNRRMNPLNPRALARAVRRGDSFVRFASAVGMQKPKTGLKKKRCRR